VVLKLSKDLPIVVEYHIPGGGWGGGVEGRRAGTQGGGRRVDTGWREEGGGKVGGGGWAQVGGTSVQGIAAAGAAVHVGGGGAGCPLQRAQGLVPHRIASVQPFCPLPRFPCRHWPPWLLPCAQGKRLLRVAWLREEADSFLLALLIVPSLHASVLTFHYASFICAGGGGGDAGLRASGLQAACDGSSGATAKRCCRCSPVNKVSPCET
jgi:hypothetical protein